MNLDVEASSVGAGAGEARVRPDPSLPSPIVHLSFSCDGSCFIVAGSSAVHWRCCDTFKLRGLYQEKDAGKTVVLAGGDMLHWKDSVCAAVRRVAAGPGSEVRFSVGRWKPGFLNYHWRYNWEAVETGGDVRAVRVHRHKTVLVHDGHVDVYDHSILKKRVETRSNPLGLCAVSQGADAPFAFACPGAEVGEVCVERWSVGEVIKPVSICAHSSRLACLAMSWDGRLVVTASVRGTVLRVFLAGDGTLVREFRRGTGRADINCIAFSSDSKWLVVSSDKATVHVFSVNIDLTSKASKSGDNPAGLKTPPEPSPAGNAKKGSSLFRRFLPSYFSSEWSLAQFRLCEGVKYSVAFGQQPNTVLIIGMDGSFYRCQFDPEKGGEMTLLEYKNFMNNESQRW